MINPALITLYILILLFAIIYFNKERLKAILLGFGKDEKEKYAKICPRCGSINVRTDFSNPVVWAYGASPKYKCRKCGYMGILFPEVAESKIKYYKAQIKKGSKFKAKSRKEESIDVSTGYFVGVWEIILALLSVPFFLIMFVFSYYSDDSGNFDKLFNVIMLLWIFFLIYIVLKLVRQRKRNKSA